MEKKEQDKPKGHGHGPTPVSKEDKALVAEFFRRFKKKNSSEEPGMK